MQVTELSRILGVRGIAKGDFVAATFEDIDGNIANAEGIVEQISEDTIQIRTQGAILTYDLWRMLSLVCSEKDISFLREGDIFSDLEHLAYNLESRLTRSGHRRK